MNKIAMIAMIACSLSGCGYGDNWTDVGPCSAEFESNLETLMDIAEGEQVGAKVIHAEFWKGEAIDFTDVIQAMRGANYECGTSVYHDGHKPAGTANWATQSVVFDTTSHGFEMFEDNYMSRSDVRMYGLQTYQDRYDRMYWSENAWEAYGALLDENHWYYAAPRFPVSYLVHEAVHLAYLDSSHDFDLANPPDDKHLTDMAYSVEWAFSQYHFEQSMVDYHFLEDSCSEIDHCHP